MKSFHLNIVGFVLVLFFLSNSINAQEIHNDTIQPEYSTLIRDFLSDNQSSQYFVGTRNFYLGTLFNSIFIDGEFEDRYTNIYFIIPMGKDIGLCIQLDDQNIFDAFIFVYSPCLNRFIQKYNPSNLLLSGHRNNILGEINRVRFRLNSSELIFQILLRYL
ncbi:MAG: hypothetical protein LBI28_11215 [Treponema sp.]|jgi:hypothetical protein|nr:hypothetical protein [Treponema sp.]